MRRLTKSAEPDVLVLSGDTWTDEYAAAIASGGGSPPERWRHAQVVSALRDETLEKCAYCEGVIADVAYPHVEHILPKKSRPDLVVRWLNLTLACPRCNTKKGDYYDPEAPLLHPYEDEPTGRLVFEGPALYASLGDDVAERTLLRLDLMHPPLFAERMKRLQSLHEALQRWAAASDADRPLRAAVVEDALADDQEFVSCLRAHAAAHGFPSTG